MRRWLWMLGGLVVWAVHFSGLYALASVADVVARADAPAWRMAGLGFSLVCAAVCAGLLVQALRARRSGPARSDSAVSIGADFAALSAGLGGLAVVWQAAPTLIGY